MAECCVERRRRYYGAIYRQLIRDEMPEPDTLEHSMALGTALMQAADIVNPPDERRAWAELARELEALTQ